jgi:hypothetical protein
MFDLNTRWTIKARVTRKTDVRRWSNARGDGTLFSIDLLDNLGTEIRATFFKEACDKFYSLIEEGKVSCYSISIYLFNIYIIFLSFFVLIILNITGLYLHWWKN